MLYDFDHMDALPWKHQTHYREAFMPTCSDELCFRETGLLLVLCRYRDWLGGFRWQVRGPVRSHYYHSRKDAVAAWLRAWKRAGGLRQFKLPVTDADLEVQSALLVHEFIRWQGKVWEVLK